MHFVLRWADVFRKKQSWRLKSDIKSNCRNHTVYFCAHMFEGCRLNALENSPCQELSAPFMLDKFWIWEDDERDLHTIEAEMKNQVYRGNIELIHLGCCMSYRLIVTGKCRGEVWNFTDVGVQPCCERQDFLGWFELWLDNQDETDYFKDYVYDEEDE